jgi:hypothetical protein
MLQMYAIPVGLSDAANRRKAWAYYWPQEFRGVTNRDEEVG